MAILPQQTLLQLFRSHASDPFFQFLTWYLILVMEWDFEEIREVILYEWRLVARGNKARRCDFVLENGSQAVLMVEVTSQGTYFVQSSMLILKEKHEE